MLKPKCANILAPTGWKFQDCKKDFVTLVRTKQGDWEVDYQGTTIPKDYYVNAVYYDPPNGLWEVTSYDPVGGHSGYKARFPSQEKAAAELVCLARGDELWEEKTRSRSNVKVQEQVKNFLAQCRKESGTAPFLEWEWR